MNQKKIKALIVDDESLARQGLNTLLTENFKDTIEIVGEAKDVPEAVLKINKLKPSLIFLDVEMPGYTGLQLLDFFPKASVDFKIIFVTAYSEYAINAFELSAIDYILKPVSVEQLGKAIDRVKDSLTSELSIDNQRFDALIDNINNPNDPKLVLPSSEGMAIIRLHEIVFLKADSSYTEIYLTDNTKLFLSKKLLEFEKLQDHGPFMRVHRSFIVNINRIKKILKHDGGILMDNGKEVSLASDKKQTLIERLSTVKI